MPIVKHKFLVLVVTFFSGHTFQSFWGEKKRNKKDNSKPELILLYGNFEKKKKVFFTKSNE